MQYNALFGSEQWLGRQLKNPDGRRTLGNRLGAFMAVQIPYIALAGVVSTPLGVPHFFLAWLASLFDDEEDEDTGVAMTEGRLKTGRRPRGVMEHICRAWTWGLPSMFGATGVRSIGMRETLLAPGGWRVLSPDPEIWDLTRPFVSAPGLMSGQLAMDAVAEYGILSGESWKRAAGAVSSGLGGTIRAFGEETRSASGRLVSPERPGTLGRLRQFLGLASFNEILVAEEWLLEAMVRADRTQFSRGIRAELRRRLRNGKPYSDLARRWGSYGRDGLDVTVPFRKSFSSVVGEVRDDLRSE